MLGYIDNVIRPVALSFLHQNHRRGNFMHQYNNDPAHTARLIINVLAADIVQVLDWLHLSPDMSPIEHFWDELVSSRLTQLTLSS